MQTIARLCGDGLSMVALAIIFASALGLHKRLRPDILLPLQFTRTGEPGPRHPKIVALWGMPILCVIILFLPTAIGATFEYEGQEAIMLMLLRFTVAAALALRQVTFSKALWDLMEKEGELSS